MAQALPFVPNQVFGVSYQINRCQKDHDALKIKLDIEHFFDSNTGILGGQWSVVWGPAVLRHNEKNVIASYIAKSPAGDLVVACNGTNFGSQWSAYKFDLVHKPTHLPTTVYKHGILQPEVSSGFLEAFNDLIALKSDLHGNILSFLNSEHACQTANIYVAGHSLGGATSPLVGLYLSHNLTNNPKRVHVVTTAGPTTGYPGLVTTLEEVFGGPLSSPQSRFQAYRNHYDIIPCAYQIAKTSTPHLSQIPGMYGNGPLDKVHIEVAIPVDLIIHKGYNFQQVDATTFSPPIIPHLHPKPRPPQTLKEFLQLIGQNHVDAYLDHFGIPSFEAQDQAKTTCHVQ